jgi:hypothetical protein
MHKVALHIERSRGQLEFKKKKRIKKSKCRSNTSPSGIQTGASSELPWIDAIPSLELRVPLPGVPADASGSSSSPKELLCTVPAGDVTAEL